MSESLKPCPFCAGRAAPGTCAPGGGPGHTRHFVHCGSCGADGPWYKDRASAVKRWNARTPGPATAAMVEQSRKLIDWYECNVDGHEWLEVPRVKDDLDKHRAFIAEHEPAKAEQAVEP